VGPWPNSTVSSSFSCCTLGVLAFTDWQVATLLAMSWLTVGVEIAVPLSFLISKFRPLSIAALFVAQGFITYFSGEIDFAFTAFAILLLFVKDFALFRYASLAGLLLVMQPWA